MPDGSSSDAPVIRPGPRIFKKRLSGFDSRFGTLSWAASPPREAAASRGARAESARSVFGSTAFAPFKTSAGYPPKEQTAGRCAATGVARRCRAYDLLQSCSRQPRVTPMKSHPRLAVVLAGGAVIVALVLI